MKLLNYLKFIGVPISVGLFFYGLCWAVCTKNVFIDKVNIQFNLPGYHEDSVHLHGQTESQRRLHSAGCAGPSGVKYHLPVDFTPAAQHKSIISFNSTKRHVSILGSGLKTTVPYKFENHTFSQLRESPDWVPVWFHHNGELQNHAVEIKIISAIATVTVFKKCFLWFCCLVSG